ncbi:ABC transporter permease [Salinilacihabitans rarus]|uniref:ABC transporter permease n=1 Tax=Salinilacihabitans rarus TaxID=2961596 RepID=UPI0020C8EC09|nr:ABC transporter permease [Salinilacihabitans rarus]
MTDTSPTDVSREPDVAEFERIDWERLDGPSRLLSAERIALVVGLFVLGAVYLAYRVRGNAYLVWRWNVGPADWLLLLSVVFLIAYGLVPLRRNRRTLRRLLGRLRARPLTALALVYLGVVLVVGFYGLVAFAAGELTDLTLDRFQPPFWSTVPYQVTRTDCAGYVADGWDLSRPCHGSLQYPLGTDRWGYDMIDLLIAGARPVVYLTVVTVGLIVPLATVVGLVAGYYGGTVDDLLMAYVDVQLSVPAIVVYLLAFMFVGNSMFLLLAAFGLLSWGGVARLVRSEALQRREEGFVLAARAVGAPSRYVLRRHLLPNVADTVVPAAAHLLAVLVLTEAGLSFLGFNPSFQSWGMTVAEGLFYLRPPTIVWWTSTFPALALATTVAAVKLAGDGLRDVLDPRWEP